MKCFVSGGAGVIGRELVSRLLHNGHMVVVGDLQPKPVEFPHTLEYIHGDLNQLCFGVECDVFFHLAATFDRLAEGPNHWEENYRHNVGLSHHLLNVIQAKRIVFASSYLIEPVPRNLTGAAKLYTECELEFLHKHQGQDSVSARIYRSYGCGSRDVISRWIRAALKGEMISVYNEQTAFDFIYAGDVAEALVRLGESRVTGIIPVGTGAPRMVMDVVTILRMMFPKLSIGWMPDQHALEVSCCHVDQMKKHLGWLPPTTLEVGIQRIIDYEKKRCG